MNKQPQNKLLSVDTSAGIEADSKYISYIFPILIYYLLYKALILCNLGIFNIYNYKKLNKNCK